MQYTKVADLKSVRDLDRAGAEAAANRSLLEYVAMMTDVDLPFEDETGTEGQEVGEDE